MMDEPEASGDYREGMRWMVVVHPELETYCAYVGIPIDSPAAGIPYEDVPVPVHGGLTFGNKGDGRVRPAGWYWWGWDYAHAGDLLPYFKKHGFAFDSVEHEWTLEEVAEEVKAALPLFEAWLRTHPENAVEAWVRTHPDENAAP